MSDWRLATLGEVVEVHDHKRVPLSAAVRKTRQGPFPYYGAQGVIDHIDDYLFDGRYILIPEDGENLNSRKLPIAYFADGRFWVNNHAHVVRARRELAVDRFIQSALEASEIRAFITGAAQPKLSQANLLRVPLWVPDLETQAKIANILDALDDLIENNRKRIQLLQHIAQRIYREWFVHLRYPNSERSEIVDSPLGRMPRGWGIAELQDVCHVIDCLHSKKPKASDEGDTLLQLFNIADGGILDLSKRYLIGQDDYRLWTSRIEVKEGDCVVTNVGRVGAVAQVPAGVTAAIGRNMTALRPKEGQMSPTFLLEYLLSPHMEAEARRKTDLGTIMDALNVKGIVRLLIPTPPPSLVRSFEQRVRPIRRSIEVAAASDLVIRRIRDQLLPKLVTGAIDVSQLDLDALLDETAA